MELSLNDLRRYVIDARAQIRVIDEKAGRRFVLNQRGQMKIEEEDKDFRLEEVLEAADRFELEADGKTRTFNRAEMGQFISGAFKKRGFAAATHHEED
jgi:hypothetical protein